MSVIFRTLSALVCGAIFGFGLSLSGMLDPTRVRGFLDIFGAFDPSLAFVLAGAVLVSTLGTLFARRMRRPVLDVAFHLPKKTVIDRPLILGSAIFGIGWGMGGFCPGPAVASLSLGVVPIFVFTAMMLVGMLLHDNFFEKRGLVLRRDADAQV
ncbi:MAG TPA: YeeE/YedE family protein [Beijerinckia sp.]|jgi:uncharacterized membrane protein YedE/YeeE|nr:YeeE/YedE family protein [Beijerinckia sp.]